MKNRIEILEHKLRDVRGVLSAFVLTCEGASLHEDRTHLAALARELDTEINTTLHAEAAV